MFDRIVEALRGLLPPPIRTDGLCRDCCKAPAEVSGYCRQCWDDKLIW